MTVRLLGYVLSFLFIACTVVAVSGAVYSEPKTDGIIESENAEDTVKTEDIKYRSNESSISDENSDNTESKDTDSKDKSTANVTDNKDRSKAKDKESKAEKSNEAGQSYIPRTTAPDRDNLCYYSDENIFYAANYGMPNCTCYAWGRAYELTGTVPTLSPYDACTWYGYNAENSFYDYGTEPKEGAIACFAYADGGSGHVAVVEAIDGDTLTLSNSAYSGTEFYTENAPLSDPANGREGWIFQGYIYLV